MINQFQLALSRAQKLIPQILRSDLVGQIYRVQSRSEITQRCVLSLVLLTSVLFLSQIFDKN